MRSAGELGWSEEWLASNPDVSRPLGVRGVEFAVPGEAAAVTAAIDLLASVDLASLPSDERFGLLDAVERSERALSAISMRSLVDIHDRAEVDERFGMGVPGYSEQRMGRDRRSWARRIKVGRCLMTRMPLIVDALVSGRLSVERANAIASVVNDRNAEVLAGAQAELLDLSDAEHRFRVFTRQLRALAALADVDGAEPDTDPETSTAKMARSGDHVHVEIDLHGLDALSFEQLVVTGVQALRRKYQRDALHSGGDIEIPSTEQLRAEVILDLHRLGAGAKHHGWSTKPTATELSLVFDAHQVDNVDPALATILTGTGTANGIGMTYPNPFQHRDSCDGCGDRHDISKVLGLDNANRDTRVMVSTGDGDPVELTAQQWQLLVCTSEISDVLLDALGEPTAVRDRKRFADTKMRGALLVRYGGCVFPGCDAPASWCDAHHVIEWEHGGRTLIVNLVHLCRRHHGIVHRTGWHMKRNEHPTPASGYFTIVTASGCRMPTQHRTPPTSRDSTSDVSGIRVGAPPGRQPDAA